MFISNWRKGGLGEKIAWIFLHEIINHKTMQELSKLYGNQEKDIRSI